MSARSGQWAGVRRSWPSSGIVSLVVATLFLVTAPAVARADEHEIAITDAGLVPDELTVVVGEPVTWTNQTSQAREILTPDHELNSGSVGPGESYGHVFAEPGNWTYFVTGGTARLQGTVHVQAAPSVATSPAAVAVATTLTGVVTTPSGSGSNSPALLLAVAIVGVIAVIAAIAGLIGASRRPGR